MAHQKLKDFADSIFVGVQTSADKVFILEGCCVGNDITTLHSEALDCEVAMETQLIRPLFSGSDIKRYVYPTSRTRIFSPYEIKDNEDRLLEQNFHQTENMGIPKA